MTGVSRKADLPGRLRSARVVLITGASGGIGQALARRCARPGATLFLWGRNADRLKQTAQECRAKGAETHVRSVDLSDANVALTALQEDDRKAAFDLVILGAGMPDIRSPDVPTEDPAVVLKMSMVNFATPAVLATEVAKGMVARRRGTIVAIGSVAAFHDLPQATAYSGSKAGLTRFITALRAALTPHGVGVTLVSPGYIDTAMSRRLEGARPFLMTPDAAARRILAAAGHHHSHVVFPRVFLLLKCLEALMPRRIAHHLLRRAPVHQKPLPESGA